MSEESVLLKVIVIGDSGVGKTNLITRLCQDKFVPAYTATIGVDFKLKTIVHSGVKYRMQIWDTAGQERFQTLTPAYYKNANGIVLVYSTTDQNSFKNIEKWLAQIQNSAPQNTSIIIVGSKIDAANQRQVTLEEGKQCGEKHHAESIEVSSKTGEGVTSVFEHLIEKIHNGSKAIPAKQKETQVCILSQKNIKQQECKC